jgi:hypothetical protein
MTGQKKLPNNSNMYKELLAQLKDAQFQPGKLSEMHFLLANEYASKSQELENLIEPSTELLRSLMIENKTVAKAQQLFELSNLGVREKKIKIQLKSLEKLLSAVKRRLETLSEESRNQY